MKPVLEHVLCVDDEPDVLMVAQMCLETVGGFKVTTAASGKEAIEKAMVNKPNLIVLDVMMPEMDGPATLKALRQNAALDNVPIVFMTARIRPSEVEEYMNLGANGVVPKPFDPMAISEQLIEIWGKFHDR